MACAPAMVQWQGGRGRSIIKLYVSKDQVEAVIVGQRAARSSHSVATVP